MGQFWGRVVRDETGGSMAEYALMIAMIGGMLVGVVTAVSKLVGSLLTPVTAELK